jgi:hypothetical protein
MKKTILMHVEYSVLMNWVSPQFRSEQEKYSVRKEDTGSVHYPVGKEE